jgi:hypothetical protein
MSRQEDADSALAVVWNLRKLGVEVASRFEPSTGNKLADDIGLLVKSHTAAQESARTGQRVGEGKRRSVAVDGIFNGAFLPYGYRRAGDRQKPSNPREVVAWYEPDPDAAPILREIFARYVTGQWSPQRIAHDLNDRQIPPPRPASYHPLKRRGEPTWHQSTVRTMLASPLYGGFAAYRDRRVKTCANYETPAMEPCGDDCPHEWSRSTNLPALVSIEVWNRAQQVLADRAKKAQQGTGGRGNHDSSPRFLLASLLWHEDGCGERVGCRAHKPDRRSGDKYRCRGRRMGTCDLPPLDAAVLDEAVREHFASRWVLDTQASVEKAREQLLSVRSSEATLAREERSYALERAADARRMIAQARAALDRGAIDFEQWGRLDRDYHTQLAQADAAVARLDQRISQAEASPTVEDMDRVLDRLDHTCRVLAGAMTAEDVPRANAVLREMFEGFYLSRRGSRIVVEPRPNPEWMPEGKWRTLDFGADETTPGVEVVDYLGAELRRVSLVETASNPIDSS